MSVEDKSSGCLSEIGRGRRGVENTLIGEGERYESMEMKDKARRESCEWRNYGG